MAYQGKAYDEYSHAQVVTASDSADLAAVSRGIYVGTAGNILVTLASGDTVLLYNLAAGVIHKMAVKRVWATSLTAANIIRFW